LGGVLDVVPVAVGLARAITLDGVVAVSRLVVRHRHPVADVARRAEAAARLLEVEVAEGLLALGEHQVEVALTIEVLGPDGRVVVGLAAVPVAVRLLALVVLRPGVASLRRHGPVAEVGEDREDRGLPVDVVLHVLRARAVLAPARGRALLTLLEADVALAVMGTRADAASPDTTWVWRPFTGPPVMVWPEPQGWTHSSKIRGRSGRSGGEPEEIFTLGSIRPARPCTRRTSRGR